MKQPGYVVLFEFPHTDASRGKMRPALLLAEAPGRYENWLICMISSQLYQCIDGFDEIVDASDDDFESSGLKTSSVIRISHLAVIESRALVGAIGTVGTERLTRVKDKLADWLIDLKIDEL